MDEQFICFAHRGASGHEPENTLSSFRKALDLGARWIECDARVVENTAIIFHDRTLQRMTGARGVVAKQTLAHIQSLTLPKGERVPLLAELLTQFKDKVSLQIELKGQRTGRVVAHEILQALKGGWDPQSLLVSSYDYEELLEFKQQAPMIPLGLLTYGYPLDCLGIAKRMGVYSVHLHIDTVTEPRVQTLQKAGYKVFVYTVDDPEDIAWLKSIRANGVFSNYPELAL
jgi:glycerophosphoryl diester phosphodiesterase